MSDGDPWRWRCPQGHTSIETSADRYRCKACGEKYLGTPYDAAEHEFPVDGDPGPVDRYPIGDVLRALFYGVGRDTETTAKASDLGDRPREIGQKLHEAEKRGLVESVGASSPYRWRLTQRGYDKARPLGNSNVADILADHRDDLGMSPLGSRAED